MSLFTSYLAVPRRIFVAALSLTRIVKITQVSGGPTWSTGDRKRRFTKQCCGRTVLLKM